MNKNVQLLFDNLRDGLLILSSASLRVIYENSAARQMVRLDVSDPAPEWLASRISAISNGDLQLPFTFDQHIPGSDASDCLVCVTLLNSPVPDECIVIIRQVSEEPDIRRSVGNIAELIACDLFRPMDDFLAAVGRVTEQLRDVPKEEVNDYLAIDSLNRSAEALKDSFNQIRCLAHTFRYGPIQYDDRLHLPLLVDEVMKNVNGILVSRHVKVSFSGIDEDLPAVYANKTLLIHSISEYVRHLLKQVDSGAHILFSIRTNGYFALLTLSNFGRLAPADKRGRRFPPRRENPVAEEVNEAHLSLSMCQRVIELCGGNLRLEKSEGLLTGITFELPVGSPKDQQDEYIRQAQRYAEDLASLMKSNIAQSVEV